MSPPPPTTTTTPRARARPLAQPGGTKAPYRDLPVMQELAAMLKVASKAANTAPLVADEAAKFMTWPEYLQFVAALRAECAGASWSLMD